MQLSFRTVFLMLSGILPMTSAAMGQDQPTAVTVPTPIDAPATLTKDELLEGIKRREGELWALEIEYEVQTKGRGIPWMMYHFAMKGEKRLRDQTEANGIVYGAAYNDENSQTFNRSSKLASVEKQKQTWVDLDFYADAIGVGVSDDDRARGIFLSSIVESRTPEWTVQPTLEVVDGTECHVLVSGLFRNRIWIDPGIGFAVRFQELYQASKEMPKAKFPLQARYFYRDFEKVRSGVYLPKKIEIVAYTPATAPESLWNQPTFSQVIDAKKLAIGDDVDDRLFRFDFPPGTTVIDRVNDRFYRIGNSGEELDVLVGEGLNELEKSRSKTRLVLVINGAVLAGILAFFAYRWLHRARASVNGD